MYRRGEIDQDCFSCVCSFFDWINATLIEVDHCESSAWFTCQVFRHYVNTFSDTN